MNIAPFLSKALQDQIALEGIQAEHAVFQSETNNDSSVKYWEKPLGFVEFIHLGEKHILDIYLSSDDDFGTSLVKTTGDKIFIVFNPSDFKNTNYSLAMMAHEIGHYKNKHLDLDLASSVSLYKEEIQKATDNEDQQTVNALVQKALLEGAYLEKEFEADVSAIEIAGFESVICMQLETMLSMTNFVTIMEKQNRIKKLYEIRNTINMENVGKDFSIKLYNYTQV
jgi:hypothetical protein